MDVNPFFHCRDTFSFCYMSSRNKNGMIRGREIPAPSHMYVARRQFGTTWSSHLPFTPSKREKRNMIIIVVEEGLYWLLLPILRYLTRTPTYVPLQNVSYSSPGLLLGFKTAQTAWLKATVLFRAVSRSFFLKIVSRIFCYTGWTNYCKCDLSFIDEF